MTFANVKLILAREMRDQLRDRRTLFVIVVLPILLYPLLGMSYFQVAQFLREESVKVLVAGAGDFGDLPPLFDKKSPEFAPYLFSDPKRAKLLQVHFAETIDDSQKDNDPRENARKKVASHLFDIAIYFPADFRERLLNYRDAVRRQKTELGESKSDAKIPPVPSPEIIYTTANEKSQIAYLRLSEVMHAWTQSVGESALAEAGMPADVMRPFEVEKADVAGNSGMRGTAGWAKLLPIMLLLWALTGAFYPAIDLCAGEKERGTLETLLSSPAERGEIVLGKLLTIMLFSMLTAALNLLSVAATGWIAFSKIGNFAMPPAIAILWLALALIPVAALFSALCLALAAFARSTKEGQYYLMPLLLVTMPLVVLPMSPGAQLNLGYSLIPVTGIVLLLRTLLEGNYWSALLHAPIVIGVTAAACMLAIRWAIDQFNSESVLFSETERLDLRLWLKRLYLDRKPTPTVAAATFCAVTILVAKFFVGFAVDVRNDLTGLMQAILIPQLIVILAPVLLMALLLTRNPLQALSLKWPSRWTGVALVAAPLAALALHPSMTVLQLQVKRLFPIGEEIRAEMEKLQVMFGQADLWMLILLLALVPAVCEELAFRGFILSGFRHMGYKWRAIAFSAFFFGVTHGILQQSLVTFLVGLILGYIAVQSGSILPGIAFHFTHNALVVLHGYLADWLTAERLAAHPWLGGLVSVKGGMVEYSWPVIALGGVLAVLILIAFGAMPYPKTAEERLREAIVRGEESHPEDEDISIGLATMIK